MSIPQWETNAHAKHQSVFHVSEPIFVNLSKREKYCYCSKDDLNKLNKNVLKLSIIFEYTFIMHYIELMLRLPGLSGVLFF